MAMQRRKTIGLTLVEVLVALVMIGVLLALIAPGFRGMMESARSAKCVHHLHQIGFTLLLYAREKGPAFEVWYQGDVGTMWNTTLLQENYLDRQSLQNLSCPKIAYASPSGSISGRHYGIYMDDPLGHFEVITNEKGQKGKVYRLNVKTHPTPASSIFLADSVTSGGDPTIRILKPASASGGAIHLRHQGRANLFFLDGHVASCGPQELRQYGVGAAFTGDLRLLSPP